MEKSAKGKAEFREGRGIGDCTEKDIERIVGQRETMGFSKRAQELADAILPMLMLLKG